MMLSKPRRRFSRPIFRNGWRPGWRWDGESLPGTCVSEFFRRAKGVTLTFSPRRARPTMRSFAQRFGLSQPKSACLTGSGASTFPKAKRIAQSDQAAPRTSFEFAKVRLYAPAETPVQTRLEVGPAADAHEKEAGRVANEIISTPGLTYPNRVAHPTIHTSRGQLARGRIDSSSRACGGRWSGLAGSQSGSRSAHSRFHGVSLWT